MEKIPIFQLAFDSDYREQFHRGVEQILDEGFLTNHTMVRELEQEFRFLNHSPYTLAVSNGTAALEIALRAIGVEGREVILPTNTFIATYYAVVRAGGIPVIVDVEEQYYSLDPQKVRERLSQRTAAVLTVHIGGHISPTIRELQTICRQHQLALVEDAAHAHFAELEGTRAGNFGDIGCFSFHTTKVVTGGEGGMLTIRDQNLFEKAHSIRQFGMDPANSIVHLQDGYNFKLGEFNALAIRLDLKRSPVRLEKRRQIAALYQKLLGSTGWRALQDGARASGSYYKQILIPPAGLSRDVIQKALSEQLVSLTGGVYYFPLHRQPVCASYTAETAYPVADAFADQHICPPCYPELEFSDVERICQLLLRLGGEP